MSKYACNVCKSPSDVYKAQCGSCSSFNTLRAATVAETFSFSRSTDVVPEENIPRITSGVSVWDNALASGLVRGTSALLGGAPGVGKSTIALQAGAGYARAGERVLFASSEETVPVLRARGLRCDSLHENLFLLSTTALGLVKKICEQEKITVCIFDSMQEFGGRINVHYTFSQTKIVLSQLNAEGSIRGTTQNEHGCDALLFAKEHETLDDKIYFSLRAAKNRNGATSHRYGYLLKERGAEAYELPEIATEREILKHENDLLDDPLLRDAMDLIFKRAREGKK